MVAGTEQLAHQSFGTVRNPRNAPPMSLLVDVDAVRATRRVAVDAHAEPHGRPFRRRSQDHMEIAAVKTRDDPTVGLVERDGMPAECPGAGNRPFVQTDFAASRLETKPSVRPEPR
jgi:hypothetical protein